MTCAMKNFLKSAIKTNITAPQVRFYSRWSHRRPAKVYTPEEYEEIEKRTETPTAKRPIFDKYGASKTSWNRSKPEEETTAETLNYKVKTKKIKKPLVATTQKVEVKSTADMLETVIDAEGNFIYTKMKDNDSRVGTILTLIKSKKDDKNDLILLEGKRLIKDAITSGCVVKYLLFSRKEDIEVFKPVIPKLGVQLYKMPYKEMQMWSDLTTTPGIMGIFKKPNVDAFIPKESLPLTVICDNIREPGNLGTILRICAGVGCHRVILTKGCVNLWDNKVLRSSAGAHFKLQINTHKTWNEIGEIFGKSANFFIADNKIVSDNSPGSQDLAEIVDQIPLLPYYGLNFEQNEHTVLVVGGETLGVSRDSYELALRSSGARLNIPLSNDVDSLNVGAALGVIAFEIKKQLTRGNAE